MSQDLVPTDVVGELRERESTEIEALTRTSDFLPQVRVFGGENTVVKEGKFPLGHFGLYFSPEKIIDLGDECNFLNIDYRPRASIVLGDAPISFFGKFENGEWIFSDSFTYIKEKAMAKVKGYLCGLEYLLWIPGIEQFGLFLMGNATLRRESGNVKALLRKAITLKIKLIKTTQYTWHGCSCFECTTPFDIPNAETLGEEVIKFRNPVDSPVEIVDETTSESERVR